MSIAELDVFPLPEFSDHFQSFFLIPDVTREVQQFSPLWKECSAIAKTTKGGKKPHQTLDFVDLHEHYQKKTDRNSRILLFPAKEVPESAWKNVKLLNVDYSKRQVCPLALALSFHKKTHRLLC